MYDNLLSTLRRSFALYDELVTQLTSEQLDQRLPGARSNRLGEQLWCVVGARESYTKAYAHGQWEGFSCSLSAENCRDPHAIATALRTSADLWFTTFSPPEPSETVRQQIPFDLLEHEAQHQGQILRYLYALGIEPPSTWKRRYALK